MHKLTPSFNIHDTYKHFYIYTSTQLRLNSKFVVCASLLGIIITIDDDAVNIRYYARHHEIKLQGDLR
jgi:hypothetical protein